MQKIENNIHRIIVKFIIWYLKKYQWKSVTYKGNQCGEWKWSNKLERELFGVLKY